MVMRTVALCGFLGLLLSGCASAPNYSTSDRLVKAIATPKPAVSPTMAPAVGYNATDSLFVMNVFRGNLLEVKLGELAQKKATNKQVKDYGARMIKDHNMAQAQLRQAARKAGINIPKDLGQAETAEYNKINSLSAQAFDLGYMRQMQTDHVKVVQLFQTESAQGLNADVKSFAVKNLPVIQDHLRQAEGILGTLNRYRIP